MPADAALADHARRRARSDVDHHRRRLHDRPAPDVVRRRVELAVEESAGRGEGEPSGVSVGGRDRRLAARVGPRARQRRDVPLRAQRRRGTIGEPPLQHAHDDGGARRIAVEPTHQDQLGAFRIAGADRLDGPDPAARFREAGGVNDHVAGAVGRQRAQGRRRFRSGGALPLGRGRGPPGCGRHGRDSTQTQDEQDQARSEGAFHHRRAVYRSVLLISRLRMVRIETLRFENVSRFSLMGPPENAHGGLGPAAHGPLPLC